MEWTVPGYTLVWMTTPTILLYSNNYSLCAVPIIGLDLFNFVCVTVFVFLIDDKLTNRHLCYYMIVRMIFPFMW